MGSGLSPRCPFLSHVRASADGTPFGSCHSHRALLSSDELSKALFLPQTERPVFWLGKSTRAPLFPLNSGSDALRGRLEAVAAATVLWAPCGLTPQKRCFHSPAGEFDHLWSYPVTLPGAVPPRVVCGAWGRTDTGQAS